MNAYKIILSDNAYKDIRDIGVYISKELCDKDAAERLVSDFYQAIDSLSSMPKRHPIIEGDYQALPKGMRIVVVMNYSIFYTCLDKEGLVLIWRVACGRRAWNNLL
jgi:plasmid stabilization system protein ParE